MRIIFLFCRLDGLLLVRQAVGFWSVQHQYTAPVRDAIVPRHKRHLKNQLGKQP